MDLVIIIAVITDLVILEKFHMMIHRREIDDRSPLGSTLWNQGPVKVERGLCEYSRAGPLTDMKVEFIKGLNQFMYTNADKII